MLESSLHKTGKERRRGVKQEKMMERTQVEPKRKGEKYRGQQEDRDEVQQTEAIFVLPPSYSMSNTQDRYIILHTSY